MADDEFYAVDIHGNQRYKKDRRGIETYATTDDPRLLYALDKNLVPRYAKKPVIVGGETKYDEYYGKIHNVPVFLKYQGREMYAKDYAGAEIYPKDLFGNDMIARDSTGQYYYAKDAEGNEKYPMLDNDSEYMPEHMSYARDKNGMPFYPLNHQGRPIYPQNAQGDEFYHIMDPFTHQVIFGRDADQNQVYARKADGGEIYPDTGQFAMNRQKEFFYAHDKNGIILYPVDQHGNERYLVTEKGSYEHLMKDPAIKRYAKDADNNEMYPEIIHGDKRRTQKPLGNRYAQNKVGDYYYPVDRYNNEYIVQFKKATEEQTFASGYPITCDQIVIVPTLNDQPWIPKFIQDPQVELDNIIGQLYRSHTKPMDYLTNLRSRRVSRHGFQPYKVIYKNSDGQLVDKVERGLPELVEEEEEEKKRKRKKTKIQHPIQSDDANLSRANWTKIILSVIGILAILVFLICINILFKK